MTDTHISPADLARILSRAGLYQLHLAALQALCELAASGTDSGNMTSLSRKLGMTTAGMTSVADSLEKSGLIIRQPSRHDRRAIWLLLTDRGRRALEDILDA